MAELGGLGQAIAPAQQGGFSLGSTPGGAPQVAQAIPGQNSPMQNAPNMRDLLAGSHEAFEQAQAQHDKLQESATRISSARKTMDKLMDLGDMVTPDDVVEAGSHLVGHGFDVKPLTELLATMPMNGSQALQGWVQMNDQKLQMVERAIKPALAQSTQHLAGRAMASLHLEHLEANHGPSPHPPGFVNTPVSASLEP